MSDKAEKGEGKKKGGKLPIILVLVLVLGGGGFFMSKKGKKEEEPAVKLAKVDQLVDLKEEFLINLAGGQSYLRCKVQLHPADGVAKADLEKAAPVIIDSIYSRLRRTTIRTVNHPDGVRLLKRQLAADINYKLNSVLPGKEEPKKKKKGKKDEDEGPPQITQLPDPEELEEPDWDSDEGPILKVYFTAFATQ